MHQTTGATRNNSPGALAGLGRSGVSYQRPVPTSACHPDEGGNVHGERSRIRTHQESLHIFDALIKASEAQENSGAQFPYKVPLTLIYEDENGALQSVTAMIPYETWSFGCVLNEDTDKSSGGHNDDEHKKERSRRKAVMGSVALRCACGGELMQKQAYNNDSGSLLF